MTEPQPIPADLPEALATPRRRWRLSPVWIIPIVAALLGGWIAVQRILAEGPSIEIRFASAEGLEAGKTTVKYNGVDVGKVTALRVASDRQQIVASVQMAPETRDWLVEGTSFWVVRPRIAGGSVTGLSTLLSGSYVGMAIGTGEERQRSFEAREAPPVVSANAQGRFFALKAASLGSLDYGTPIYFRRIQVGQVAAYQLDADGRELTVRVFINSPYDRYVKPETRFWQASGLDVSVDANGLQVRTQSLVSILVGGLAFDTPADGADAEPAAAETSFRLYADEATAMKAPQRESTEFVLYFDESIRGLSVGAPLTFLGLPVGEVGSIRLEAGERRNLQVRARVVISVFPQRFLDILADKAELTRGRPLTAALRHDFVDRLVARGLRAQLRAANLLSGQQYIALEYVPNADRARVNWASRPPVFPVAKGGLSDIEARLASILARVDRWPIEAIGEDLKRSLARLAAALGEVEALGRQLRGELTPELSATLAAAERALDSAGRTIAPDSPLAGELQGTLAEVRAAAQSIRVLADYLERHPEALLRGKATEE